MSISEALGDLVNSNEKFKFHLEHILSGDASDEEISDAGATMDALHWYGAVFLMGRLMHGVCFGFMRRNFFLRVGGMILTLFPIAGLAVIMLVQHV